MKASVLSIPAEPVTTPIVARPLSGALQLVTDAEVRELDEALSRGCVPLDLEGKLDRLANGNLVERYVEKNCRTIISLLEASSEGIFRTLRATEREQLLRVVAYVRKDEDAIADYQFDGFVDDQQQMRQIAGQLSARLEEFKAWRLLHQVPEMWHRATR